MWKELTDIVLGKEGARKRGKARVLRAVLEGGRKITGARDRQGFVLRKSPCPVVCVKAQLGCGRLKKQSHTEGSGRS